MFGVTGEPWGGVAFIADLHPEFIVYTVVSSEGKWLREITSLTKSVRAEEVWWKSGVVEVMPTQELKSNVPKIQPLQIINSH